MSSPLLEECHGVTNYCAYENCQVKFKNATITNANAFSDDMALFSTIIMVKQTNQNISI